MTNILMLVLFAATIGLVFLLPALLGLVLRLIFKRADGRLIAALAGAVFFMVGSKVTPWSEADAIVTKATQGMGMEIRLFMRVFIGIIWALVSFGIPYMLAMQGVSRGQTIMKRRNPNNGVVRTR